MTDTCGRTSPLPFASYDPDSSSLKTWRDISLWDSMQSSLTLPPSGSMRSGECFERPTLAPATNGHDSSSLLPTPASAAGLGGNLSRSGDRKDELLLPGLVKTFLPTPTAGDAKSTANRTAGRSNPNSKHHDGLTLTDATRMLPTPTARDHKGANQKDTTCLPGAITALPSNATNEPRDDAPPTLSTTGDDSTPDLWSS